MTDYAPFIAPLSWSNTYSGAFCTLLSICATDLTVTRIGSVATVSRGDLSTRAGSLLRRELMARLATVSLDHSVDPWDQLVGSSPQVAGQARI